MQPWEVKPIFSVSNGFAESESEEDEETTSASNPDLSSVLPKEKILEEISVQLLDALIKRGQMEMAKGAFKTQLEVLRKVQPEQVSIFLAIFSNTLRLIASFWSPSMNVSFANIQSQHTNNSPSFYWHKICYLV